MRMIEDSVPGMPFRERQGAGTWTEPKTFRPETFPGSLLWDGRHEGTGWSDYDGWIVPRVANGILPEAIMGV